MYGSVVMTTRRRRAGSDSNQFDINDQQQGEISNTNEHCAESYSTPLSTSHISCMPLHGTTNGFVGLNWGTPPVATKQQDSYYKKTDSLLPSPQIFTPSPLPSHINNNSHYNSNSENILNSASSGAISSNLYNIGEGVSNYFGSNFNNNNYNNSNNQYFSLGGNSSPLQGHKSSPHLKLFGSNDTDSDLDMSSVACRDRTSEFAGILRSQQQGHSLSNGGVVGGRGLAASKATRDLTQYSHFMKRSRMVGHNISSTYAKLEKMTVLARKRSLFDDSQDAEIQELTAIIRHDLTSLTKQLEDLRKCSAVASAGSGSSGAHLQKHSANLVGSLQTKVATITQKFRDVLEVRTENLKRQAERREQFAGSSLSNADLLHVASAPQLGMVHGASRGSVLLADEAKAVVAARRGGGGRGSAGAGEVVLDFDGITPGSGGGSTIAPQGAYQQQLQLMEEQDSLLQSRAETMRTIESTIVELGTMFTQLAAMVKEQDELVHRIDANVDDAEMNVEAAHTELLKYFRSVSSNRWLMLKVFGIVILFFIVFVVFMA